MSPQPRILTGDRPTGKLHLGTYLGSLANRVALQRQYETFVIIADLHLLTTKPEKEHIQRIPEIAREMVLDYLAVGIDPEIVTIYLQSGVPQVAELALLFGMLVSVPRLERIPSLKAMAQDANLDVMPYGLLGYPVLQAADILMVRAHLVPVGRDNQAHVEVTREIARRFNYLYGPVFPEPDILLSEVSILPGTDGAEKMGKSAGNAIFLSDDRETVERKVRGMFTDPARVRADIPGRVEGNPVFVFHDAFNPNKDEVAELKEHYRQGRVGDVEVKQKLAAALNAFLDPIRERRAEYAERAGLVEQIIGDGTANARREAAETLRLVREAMGLDYSRMLNIENPL